VSKRLLIVGGTGFIGRNLAFKAVREGFNTFVLSLNAPNDEKKVEGVNYLQADITSLAQLKERLSNTSFEYVINLAGYIDHSRFLEGGQQIIDSHFGGVQNLLRVLEWGALKRFVQIGSSDEYGNLPAPQVEEMRESPISPYSLGKVATTQLLQMLHRTEGLPVVIVRLFLVYGPGQGDDRFLPQIIRNCILDKNFPTSTGEQLRDFCFIEDVSRGILMTLINNNVNGEVINIASGKSIAIREVVEYVQRVTRQGTPEFGNIPYRSSESMELYANISKAHRLLGWIPEVSFEQGIDMTISSMKKKIL
jgi:nucleoside-diphosphate-sugar epimerase